MRRRTFIVLAAAAGTAPIAAHSERPPSRPARIGWLTSGVPGPGLQAFKHGLRDHGYIEGRHFSLVLRFAEGRLDRLDDLARELVRDKVDVIVASPTSGALAAKRATRTIPIIVPLSLDAVRAGVVSNLARPGGNVTGLTLMSGDIVAKRLELMRETLPALRRIAFLVPGAVPEIVGPFIEDAQRAAATLGISVVAVEIRGSGGIETAFDAVKRAKVDGLYILESQALLANRERIGALTQAHKVPAISGSKDYVGLLMSYGPNGRHLYRRAAELVKKVLEGENPGELPMEQPTTFELMVNLKVARALGIVVPPTLLARADEVVE